MAANPSLNPGLLARIESDFTYHAPLPNRNHVERYQAIRDRAKELALLVADEVPEGREQSLALTKVEEAVMWANAGIARHES